MSENEILEPAETTALMEALPEPTESVPGETFHDRILLLLAAVATSDGLLSYRAYGQVQDAAQAIFGERALHAEMQAKLHYALLHPPVEEAVDIARSMARQAEAQKVSASFVESLLTALHGIAEHSERMDEAAHALVEDIEWAFRRASLEKSPSPGVGESLSALYGKASRTIASWWPGRREDNGKEEEEKTFTPETTAFNADMARSAADLERIAWTVDDEALQEELRAFRKMIRPQPFKIVVVGERKRGKSSLINALLGERLSPVRESAPETATVLEFHHAPAPEYQVSFLDSAQFAHMEEYLAGEEGNLLLARRVEAIRRGAADGSFAPGRVLSGITCWDDLPDYVRLDGRFSALVARVSVGLPLPALADGVALVDTPGLNDTDAFHDYLAYEESLEADCVLFVMDARDPGSRSELALLRRLARSGRAVCLIGALTNIDRLNDAESLDRAREQARKVLQEVCRSGHVQLAGLVTINTRQAEEEHCGEGSLFSSLREPASQLRKKSSSVDELLRLLREVMTLDSGKALYRRKVAESYASLARLTSEGIRQQMERCREALPDAHVLSLLETHADELEEAVKQSLDQARQIVEAAGLDLVRLREETDRSLVDFEEHLSLQLIQAIERRVTELGHSFARDREWKDFEKQERRICQEAVDDFLRRQQEALAAQEEKLRIFSARGDDFSQDCLNRLSRVLDDLPDASPVEGGLSNRATHFLVQSHQHMKSLALLTTGAAAGRALSLGPVSLLLSVGALTANPMLAGIVATVAGVAGFIYHLGREDKLRAAFLERKEDEVRQKAARLTESLREEVAAARLHLGEAYQLELRRSFAPTLERLCRQAVHLRLFLKVMHKIDADIDLYEKRVENRLEEIHKMSLEA